VKFIKYKKNFVKSVIGVNNWTPNILRRTIGWNNLGELYVDLSSLEIIIDVEFLKYKGKKLRSIQVFVILIKLVIQLLLVTKVLR